MGGVPGRGPGRTAPSASFIRYAVAFPKAVFRFHLAQLCYMTILRSPREYLAFIAQVIGAGEEEGVENRYWISQ